MTPTAGASPTANQISESRLRSRPRLLGRPRRRATILLTAVSSRLLLLDSDPSTRQYQPLEGSPQLAMTCTVLRSWTGHHRGYHLPGAEVAELADAPDSKSGGPRGPCGFDPHLRHQRREVGSASPSHDD